MSLFTTVQKAGTSIAFHLERRSSLLSCFGNSMRLPAVLIQTWAISRRFVSDNSGRSRLQVHPPQQVLEARVVAERVKFGPNICEHDTEEAFVKGVVQQFNGPILVAKLGVKACFCVGL